MRRFKEIIKRSKEIIKENRKNLIFLLFAIVGILLILFIFPDLFLAKISAVISYLGALWEVFVILKSKKGNEKETLDPGNGKRKRWIRILSIAFLIVAFLIVIFLLFRQHGNNGNKTQNPIIVDPQRQYDSLVEVYNYRMMVVPTVENAQKSLKDDSLVVSKIVRLLEQNPALDSVSKDQYVKAYNNRVDSAVKIINKAVYLPDWNESEFEYMVDTYSPILKEIEQMKISP